MKKKFVKTGIILSLSMLSFYFYQGKVFENNHSVANKKSTAISTKGPQLRDIASTPVSKKLVQTIKQTNIPLPMKRQVIGNKKENYRVANTFNKNWKKIYISNFKRMTKVAGEVSNFKVEKKKSIIKVKGKIGELMEHIVVSYNMPDGRPFSYEALINSQNGQVEQTWNQTRYEQQEAKRYPAAGYSYKAE